MMAMTERTTGRAITSGWKCARTLASVAAVGSLAACGGGNDAPADSAEVQEASVEWVAPRDSDILLADFSRQADGSWSVGTPVNITQRVDYDNQPAFTPDGADLLYTANDPQSGQADIWRYDIAAGTVTPVTSTAPESEYSAAYTADQSGVTVIRVEADSTQRLWRIPLDGGAEHPVFSELAPVGYYAEPTSGAFAMFVLGNPATLRSGRTGEGMPTIHTENIGRSIQLIPQTTSVSYVQRHDDGSSTIMRLDGIGDGAQLSEITPALADGDFHAWTPDGQLLMADGAGLFAFDPDGSAEWTQIADFAELSISLSRLAVHPEGSQIALVAESAIDLVPGN